MQATRTPTGIAREYGSNAGDNIRLARDCGAFPAGCSRVYRRRISPIITAWAIFCLRLAVERAMARVHYEA